VLRKLVELGGDLRLHDVNGLVVRNWATRQMNVARRNKNIAFLLENQNRALTYTGRQPVDQTSSGASGDKKSATDVM
jgi:hypothetical protein